jgi:hypothetical protein
MAKAPKASKSVATASVAIAEAPAQVVQTPTKSKAEPYFLGTTEECPYWNLSLAGITFQRETCELHAARRGDDEILEQGPPSKGHLEMLTPVMVERAKKAAKTKVVRWFSPPRWEEEVNTVTGERSKVFKGRGAIFSTSARHVDAPAFVPEPTDEPIGKYLYMMPVASIGSIGLLGSRADVKIITLHEAMEKGLI